MLATLARFGSALLDAFKALLIFVVGLAAFAVVMVYVVGSVYISEIDVATIYSPDNETIAIIEETNGGATTSFGYSVYLKANSVIGFRRKAAALYGAVRSECAYGVDVVWRNPEKVEIQYLSSKLDPDYAESLLVGTKLIGIELVPGVGNPSAPCGGM
jgi:hypothetical protein